MFDPLWQFIHEVGFWRWRKIEPHTGGVLLEGKNPLHDFSQIVDDAMQFGYSPTSNDWTITYHGQVTRYRKGLPV